MNILNLAGRICALIAGGLLLWGGAGAIVSKGRIVFSLLENGAQKTGYQHVSKADLIQVGATETWIGSGSSRQHIVLHELRINDSAGGQHLLLLGDIPTSDFWIVPHFAPEASVVTKVRRYIANELPIVTATDAPLRTAIIHLGGSLIVTVLGAIGVFAAIFWRRIEYGKEVR
ncbi:MAG: hypothetical protein ACOYOF_14950 [Verrucomicrobiaceae bacterium]